MLNRAHRLRRSSDFSEAVRRGQRAGRATLVVHLRLPAPPANPPGQDPPPRAGFVVSRAVGGAVVRNRVRRRLRHLVRTYLPDLPHGAVVVVRALPPAAGATSAQLDGDLRGALRTASSRAGVPAVPRERAL